MRVLQHDLRMNLNASFNVQENDVTSVTSFWHQVLVYFEKDKAKRDKGLVGLETIKELIVERNCDVVPYFKFIVKKFGRLNKKRIGRFSNQDGADTRS